MKTGNIFTVKFLALLLSALVIDGGHTYYLLHNQSHPVILHKHSFDLEVPGHDRYEKLADDENLIKSEDQELISIICMNGYTSFISQYNSQDFSNTVWQPPRFI